MKMHKEFLPVFPRHLKVAGILGKDETKSAEVKQVVEKGRVGAEVAREYGIPEGSVYKWVKQYHARPINAFPGSGNLSGDDGELIRLRREVKRLEAENEFLKMPRRTLRGKNRKVRRNTKARKRRGCFRACVLLGVSRSGYYSWRCRESCPGAVKDRDLPARIRGIFDASRRTYVARRILRVLVRQGTPVSRRKVARIMRQEKLTPRAAARRRMSTTNSRHALPVAPNLLNKDFWAERPNRAFVTDVTSIRTLDRWLYLAVVLDLYSRRVVGWAMSENNDRFLVIEAMNMALRRRKPEPGLIVHSDRGSTFCSFDFQDLLRTCGAVSSMSAKGDCYDNACAESFFHSLKVEWLYPNPDNHAFLFVRF